MNNKKLLEWIEKNKWSVEDTFGINHEFVAVVEVNPLHQAITNGELEQEVSTDVQDAIDFINSDITMYDEIIEETPTLAEMYKGCYRIAHTILDALRQMQVKEPESCIECRDGEFWVSTKNYTHCPYCGRKL